jgi:molecular chaperone DnaJ
VGVNVKIPAGIDSDQRLRLRGEGEIAEPGGRAGDLYVIVRVKEHALFRREEEHIILDLPITFVQAALGDEVEVPTLGGKMTVDLPAGIQSGELIRLRGKGIRRLNGSGFGDQVVRILVETPTRLSNRQKDLLKDFAKEADRGSYPTIDRFLQKFKEMFKA